MPSSWPPRFTGSQRHHANLLDPCRERRVGHAKASNHADPLRTARMRAAASWAASRRPQRLHGGARKSTLRCLRTQATAAHAHSKQPADGLTRADALPMKPLADELEQPPFANQPAEGLNRTRCRHVSFSCGHQVGSSSKRRLPEVKSFIVEAGSSSLRSTWSTFTGSTCRMAGFTRSVERMYLLCFNALRDTYRVLTGRFYRLCRIYPSSRHGRGVSEAAGKGTRAWTSG